MSDWFLCLGCDHVERSPPGERRSCCQRGRMPAGSLWASGQVCLIILAAGPAPAGVRVHAALGRRVPRCCGRMWRDGGSASAAAGPGSLRALLRVPINRPPENTAVFNWWLKNILLNSPAG